MIKCECTFLPDKEEICHWHRQLWEIQATVTALLTALENDLDAQRLTNALPTEEIRCQVTME